MNTTTAIVIVVSVGLATAAYVLIKRSHENPAPVQLQPVVYGPSPGSSMPVHGASPAQSSPVNTITNIASSAAKAVNTAKDLFNQGKSIFNTFKGLF
ncbi:MAG: hypothetical protein ACJ8AT_31245 [Hyalangium sp.]|uniref:hypothetical protein n=1 Tax=Hyalangium sp. TaxID=2028555 RepID=UPI00389ADB8F